MISLFIKIVFITGAIFLLFFIGLSLIAIIDTLFFSSGAHVGRMSGACGDGSGAHESGGGAGSEEEEWYL